MLTAYDPFAGSPPALPALHQPPRRPRTMTAHQRPGRAETMPARQRSGMPMDAYRVGDHFVAHFDLPGVDPGSIDLSVEGTTLTISAERSVPQLEGAQWQVAERPFGSYTR